MQARTILLQTGLAQQTLAAVWNISDIDKVRTQTDISGIFLLFFLYSEPWTLDERHDASLPLMG